MEHELCSHLTKCAEAYAAAEGCVLSRVGRMAAGDSAFFKRIHETSFTARIYDRTMAWFDRNWPEGLAWPAGVPRVRSRKSETA